MHVHTHTPSGAVIVIRAAVTCQKTDPADTRESETDCRSIKFFPFFSTCGSIRRDNEVFPDMPTTELIVWP